VLPPPNNTVPYDAQYAGVILNDDGDLVYTWEPLKVFMSKAEIDSGYYSICTGTKDQSGEFEIINIHQPDGTFDRFFFGADTGNRLMRLGNDLIRVGTNVPNELSDGANRETFISTSLGRNGYGQVSAFTPVFVYSDPTNLETQKALVSPGTVFPTEDGVTLTVDNTLYLRVGNTPLGRAWIKALDFTLFSPDNYLPRIDCEEDGLEEGKITSCN
jgi:hypothetical protein